MMGQNKKIAVCFCQLRRRSLLASRTVISRLFSVHLSSLLYNKSCTGTSFHACYLSSHRVRIYKRFRSPGIDSKELMPPAYVAWRAGTITLFHYLSYWPARLKRLKNRFLGPLSVYKFGLWSTDSTPSGEDQHWTTCYP